MKLLRCFIAGWLCFAPVLSSLAQEPGAKEGYVVVCTIDGMIDSGIAVIAKRAVEEARGADALIFIIDTFGGRVDSAIDITSYIGKASCPTIAYIDGKGAISAGALISYSCDEIIMAPGTNIGASTPYQPGAEASEQVTEKSMSFLRAKYRALGEDKGHDPLLGEAMVDNEIELRGAPNADGTYTIFKIADEEAIESSRMKKDPIGEIFEAIGKETDLPLDGLEEAARKFMTPEGKDEGDVEGEVEEVPAPVINDILPDGTKLICEAGKLLTLTHTEAMEYGLIPTTATSIDEVMGYYGYGGLEVRKVDPNWAEQFYRWLSSPMISGLLLMMGLGGLYLEIRTPGIGLPALIGITCLAVFFGSYYVMGLAGVEDLALLLIGLVLVGVEIFVLPGFGFVGLAGFVCIIAGLVMSMTRVTIPEFDWQWQRLEDAGQTFTVALSLFAVLTLLTWKFLPRTRLFKALQLNEQQLTTAGYTVQSADTEDKLAGMEGVATSRLSPSGRGRFNGKTYDIVTRGEYIDKGTKLVIIHADGNRYVVTEQEEKS